MTHNDTLAEALRLHREYGWAPVPVDLDEKKPLLKGMFKGPPRTAEDIHTQWKRATWRLNHRDNPEWNGHNPNLAIHLGFSHVIIIDADTPDEVAAWYAACEDLGFDPGPPTVKSAGATNADGSVRHSDGGHWYYTAPNDLVFDGAINYPVTPGAGPTGHVMGGARIALRPPSFRNGKDYTFGGGPDQRPLPDFLRDVIEKGRTRASARTGARPLGIARPGYRTPQAEVDWSTRTPMLTLLPAGWQVTGDDYGCLILAHPEASSDRSAVSHDAGCPHIPDSDVPLLTIFSSGVGEWLAPLVAEGTPRTISKLRLFAARHYDGDLSAARRALGLTAHVIPASAPITRKVPSASVQASVGKPKFEALKLPAELFNYGARSVVHPPAATTAPSDSLEAVGAEPSTEPGREFDSGRSPTEQPPEPGDSVVGAPILVSAVLDRLEVPPPPTAPTYLASLFKILSEAAQPMTPDLWEFVSRTEATAGKYAGRDDEPERWSEWHHSLRDRRATVLGARHITTTDIADALGIAPERARALLRALIPALARDHGIALRERPPYDPFTYDWQRVSAPPEQTDWAVWKLLPANSGRTAA